MKRRRRKDKCIGIIRLGEKNGNEVGALDRRAKLWRKGQKRVDYVKLEKDGKMKFVRGDETLMVPSLAACRERLVKLLEQTGGDPYHSKITEFFSEQHAKVDNPDEMRSQYAHEVCQRLDQAWKELTTPPEPDLFAEFDL